MTIPNFNYIIEPISSQHNRDDFHCGIEALDYYLKKQAKQDVRRFLTAVFVLHDLEKQRISGYYTLAATAIPTVGSPTRYKSPSSQPSANLSFKISWLSLFIKKWV